MHYARIAQLVEHDLAKVGVAGSNPVSRSQKEAGFPVLLIDIPNARVVESVDTPDLKSCALLGVRVQVPPRVQNPVRNGGVFVFKNAYNGASTLCL